MIDLIASGITEDKERTASSNLRNNSTDDDDDDAYCDYLHKSSIDYSVGVKFMRH